MSMSKKKTDNLPSRILLSALLRSGAGVHKDQKVKKDQRALRRDKTYKEDR